jgi:hypothetical protein
MSVEKEAGAEAFPARAELVLEARRLVRVSLKGALASLDYESGHPYASLVLTATEPDGSPLFLLSSLARHGKNLRKDPRASLLLDGTGETADPLTGNRLTLFGEVEQTATPTARARFLARHPSANDYVGFADFAFFSLKVTHGHFIGGFGRIFTIQRPELLTDVTGADALLRSEPEIIAHMNEDHREAIGLYATELANAPAGDWRMTGIDPEGTDLLHRTNAVRIVFDAPVRNPAEARNVLVALAQTARVRRSSRK